MSNKVHEIHSQSKVLMALNPQAIASDTTTVGNTIDTAGFEALEFLLATKTITDGDYDVQVFEGDESDMSDEAAVAAADLLGDVAFTDDTDDLAVARLGYIGKKRYVRIKIVSTSTSIGVDIILALALLATAHHQPVANQNG